MRCTTNPCPVIVLPRRVERVKGSSFSGPPTFVFTDIEGSTSRWERYPVAMQTALARHDALLRSLFDRFGGTVFNTVGDAFCAAFESPVAAVETAIELQRALAAENFAEVGGLRVRIAVHTGLAEQREGDFFGPSVNRVARLLAVAHGGQIVISEVTKSLIADGPEPEFRMLDLGEHRLRDLLRSERIYQPVAADLQSDFPPLRSLAILANNLPQQLTAFVGRERVVDEVTGLLYRHRLVTLTGAGGVGKSRISLQVAANLVDGSGNGVWFVEFASLHDPELVPIAVAAAAGVELARDLSATDALVHALRGKNLVLVLDNCEHLVASIAELTATLLKACPRAAILASSRQPLGVAGESTYYVPSLSLPSRDAVAGMSATEALQFEALQLFQDRARDANHRFELTNATAPVIAEICLNLDGIALAIELAAARMRILTPVQILSGLEDRFRFLTGGNRSTLPRQRTLRALIDWSYDLLDDDERRLLCRLAFLSGSFSLDGAEAIYDENREDVFALVAALLDKSLITVEASDGDSQFIRFRIAESIRLYAIAKVTDAGERERISRRAIAWSENVVTQAHEAWAHVASERWQSLYAPERDNLRASLSLTLERRSDVTTGLRLAATSRRFWGRVAPTEGSYWITLASGLRDERTPVQLSAALDLAAAHLNVALGKHEGTLAAAFAALENIDSLDDDVARGEALTFAGYALARVGRVAEAKPLLLEAIALFRAHGAHQLTAYALNDFAIVEVEAEEFDRARELYAAALDEFRAIANHRGMHAAIANLAELEYRTGNARAAVDTLAPALALERDSRDGAQSLANGACYRIALGRWDDAYSMARESLLIAGKARAESTRFQALHCLAAIAALRDDPVDGNRERRGRAATLLGYLDARIAEHRLIRRYTEQTEYDRTRTALQRALGMAEFERLYASGLRLDASPALD